MNMHSLTPSISLILAQALIVIALMVKIGIDGTNGAQSQRVFFWAGKTYRGPNRTTQQELDADKARLEAAPDEDKPGIIAAMHAEKKKAMQEAEAEQTAEEAEKETAHLLSKLHIRYHYGGYRVIFEHPTHTTPGPNRSRTAEPDLTDDDLKERAQKDRQKVVDAAWDGMSASDVAQLVKSLKPNLNQKRPAGLADEGNLQEQQRKRKTRQEKQEDRQMTRESLKSGRVAKGADVFFAKDLADFLFKLHIGEGAATRKQKFDSRCLAQLCVLSYIYASRVIDIFELPPENLIQDKQEFKAINYKRDNSKRQQQKQQKQQNLCRTCEYTASVYPEERSAWSRIWDYFGFNNPDRSLLFSGEEYGSRRRK